jgi:hypothetical protein
MSSNEFLKNLNIESVFNAENTVDEAYLVNDKLTQVDPFKPDLSELKSLHNLVTLTNRTTILEFGCGWSSLVFAASLAKQELMHGTLDSYRRNNPFHCFTVDNNKGYLDISAERIPAAMKKYISFNFSEVEMESWDGRYAHAYLSIPLMNPDLIYIDAPGQHDVKGSINGFNISHNDLMPMSCDILKLEHFLTPLTIVVIDGRAANARFIKSNLQRSWDYRYCKDRDQHFFLLNEDSLGKYQDELIKNHYYKDSSWTIEDF